IDGNITPIANGISRSTSLYKGDFVTFKHPLRNCFTDEHYACIEHNKAEHALKREQLSYNVKLGLKPKQGMFQTGVIYRNHTDEVIEFCDDWYNEWSKFTHRDQLSIMTAVHNTGFTPVGVPWTVFNKHFKLSPHAVKPSVNVYYFTPYNTSGNIGKAMNDHCKLVPND